MINRVIIRRFKRFGDVTFDIPGHIVLAGPNNTGKTTLLQAIAAWSLALTRWKQLNDFNKRKGYTRAPIARQTFSAVPVRSFDLLWNDRRYEGNIEIEVRSSEGWTVPMEFQADSTEQIYVRPTASADAEQLRAASTSVVFVPPMTGLSIDEPVYQAPKIAQLLGQGKPGDVIRNLLVLANQSELAWRGLTAMIDKLFGYELLPPDATGADILAQYRSSKGGREFEVASAGSGFQQVLMLLSFLYTNPASILLLDEPDAHLHVILQDAIYGELRSVAMKSDSQLIVATHSEVIIDSVEPRELYVLFDGPRRVADTEERTNLIRSLSVLSNTDVMLAMCTPGILYTEGHTDIDILKEWARVLGHRAYDLMTRNLFWKPTVWETRPGSPGIKNRDHYEALKLVRLDIPGIVLLDGDDQNGASTDITGKGLQCVRWRRYEVESYLLHPDALARFVVEQVGAASAEQHVEDMTKFMNENYPPAVIKEPHGDHEFLNTTKARTKLLPPLLDAAGLHGYPYTRYSEIAALMRPEEIHPEVVEKLDAICKALNQ